MPDGALVLGFDCSGPWCAAALVRGPEVLAARHEAMTKGQAERLMPMLAELLDEAGAAWSGLAAIGVGVGPGNFTGIRVAVAAARGLALGLEVPAIAVSATEAAALGLPRPCRVVLPARAGAVFWQDFTTPDLPDVPVPPAQGMPDALPPAVFPVLPPALPIGEATARIAALRLAVGGRRIRPAPIYLRPADAAPPSDPPPVILPG